MPEILEGKFNAVQQDHKIDKAIFLIAMSVITAVPLAHLSAIVGIWFGETFL